MPRGRLSEKHVQCVAVEWLASYYADKEGAGGARRNGDGGQRRQQVG